MQVIMGQSRLVPTGLSFLGFEELEEEGKAWLQRGPA